MNQPQPIRPPSNTTNTNIWAFLDYYCALKSGPKYAVLIKGPWGSGKSHLIKAFFAAKPKFQMLYVSLYGMKDVSDIESAFFSQLHPLLSSPGMKVAAAVAKGLLQKRKD